MGAYEGAGSPSISADFTCTPLSGSAPLTTSCTDASTGDVTDWSWDFGDRITSTLTSPTHTYTVTGTFTVTGTGSSDSLTRPDYIVVSSATLTAVNLPRTGQLIAYYPGDDGDIQAGVGWPTPRFTDNGDGTVMDNLTGLVWLQDVNCINRLVAQ